MQPRYLLLIPGTLFWVFLVIAIVTKEPAIITITVLLGVGTFVGFGSAAIRKALREKKMKRRVWKEGIPATAKVVRSLANGNLNNHPYVEMHLEVTDANGRISFADVRQVISQIMASRVQPGSEIAVKIDPTDPAVVVVDEELTPYGY